MNRGCSSDWESNRLKTDRFKNPVSVMGSNPIIPTFSIPEARIHAHLCGDGCMWKAIEKRSPGALKKHKRRKILGRNGS